MIWLWIAGYLVMAFATLVLFMMMEPPKEGEENHALFFSLIWPVSWLALILVILLTVIKDVVIFAATWCAGILKP